MSSAGIGGANFVFLFFGLCTKSVIVLLLKYKVDLYLKYSRHKLHNSEPEKINLIIVTAPPHHDIFSKEVYMLKRNGIKVEHFYKERIAEVPYSLASKLVCFHFILYFEQ